MNGLARMIVLLIGILAAALSARESSPALFLVGVGMIMWSARRSWSPL